MVVSRVAVHTEPCQAFKMVLVARVVYILDALEGFKILSVLSIKTFAYHFRFDVGQS